MFEYNIEIDTMNGMETYKFQSELQSIEKCLQESMFRGNLKTALSFCKMMILNLWDIGILTMNI